MQHHIKNYQNYVKIQGLSSRSERSSIIERVENIVVDKIDNKDAQVEVAGDNIVIVEI